MKQTIEINGFTIVIDTTEENVKVTAEKDGEIVEEFSLDTEGQEEGQGQSQAQEEFGGQEEPDFDENEEVEEDEELPTVESYQAFLERIKTTKGKK